MYSQLLLGDAVGTQTSHGLACGFQQFPLASVRATLEYGLWNLSQFSCIFCSETWQILTEVKSVLCTPTACPALGTAVRWGWWDCQINKMWCCSSSAVPATPVPTTNTLTRLYVAHTAVISQQDLTARDHFGPALVLWGFSRGCDLAACPSFPLITAQCDRVTQAHRGGWITAVQPLSAWLPSALLGSTAEQIIHPSVCSLCWKWQKMLQKQDPYIHYFL